MGESPSTALRAVLKAALTELLPAEWDIRDGKLHPSLGGDATYGFAGTSPEDETPLGRDHNTLGPLVLVQVFLPWPKVVDNDRTEDPAAIEQLAEDFREEVRQRQDTATEEVWFMRVERLWYPDDPVGQKTRFYAHVRGMTQNTATILRESGP